MNASTKELKISIVNSLSSFNKGSLLKNTTALFNTLGYFSDKAFDLSPNSADNFLDTFDEKNIFQKEKALLKNWRTIDVIFQLTDEEIYALGSGQRSLQFDIHKKIDNKIIQSYLFVALQLKKGHYTRTDLSNITREINKLFPMPVFILFKNGEYLTLSVINRRLHQRDASKDVLEKVTLIKDIRFAAPHRAHIEILYDLSFDILYDRHRFTSFVGLHETWRNTLDSEKLNKRFYRELATWYFWALKEVAFPSQNKIPGNTRNPINVIRLITRIIFVWFVKEKGLIPESIFNRKKAAQLLKDFSPDSSSYYKAVLQNLFFATLSTKMGDRKFRGERRFQGKNDHYGVHNVYRYKVMFNQPDDIIKLFKDTPFLNGGLFECLDRLTVKPEVRVDGFSDRLDNELNVPNYLFFSKEQPIDLNEDFGTKGKKHTVRGLIDLLQSYKFTITENTPIEEEIALDPELLGRVFENLLANYNPETQTTARKLTGSFYTPREIVNYMVDESLIAYLESTLVENYENQIEFKAKAPQSQQKIFGTQKAVQIKLKPSAKKMPAKKRKQINENLRHIFSYNDEAHRFDPDETDLLIHAIDNLKILDPACGSGAFPMGILHRLVFILHKLDPKNRLWKNKQIEKVEQIEVSSARKAAIEDIEQAFEKNALDYARKLFLIQNCIFGVDIQPVAVQIAKLRFFISLIVEQDIDDKSANRGMMPLPNLETKIVAANSLIGFRGKSPLRGNTIIDLENELKQVRKKYFDARSRKTKRQCEEKDKTLREKINQLIKKERFSNVSDINLDQWDPYNQNEAADFFDTEWMFGEKQGFDIVIGNPPYVRQEKIRHFKPVFKDQYNCYTGMADLYVYFYERGFEVLKTGGILTYISSNKYFRAAYGKKLRHFLSTRSFIYQLIDFGDAPVFTSIAYPSIIILKKMGSGVSDREVRRIMFGGKNDDVLNIRALNWKTGPPLESFPDIFSNQSFSLSQSSLTDDGWRLEPFEVQRLLQKLQDSGKPLAEFVGGKFFRGIVTGFNKAFVVDRETKKRLVAEHSSSEEILKPFLRGRDVKRWKLNQQDLWLIFTRRGTDINKYPAIRNYLKKYRKRLTPGIQGGRKPGQYKWFEIQDNIAYWKEFERPKIIYPNICKRNEFAWDNSKFYTNQKAFIIPDAPKYLLGILNSSIVMWLFTKLLAKLQHGYYEPSSVFFKRFPIPLTDDQKKIEEIVENILTASKSNKNTNVLELEVRLDSQVAHLYRLNEEEYSLILNETKMPDPFRISTLNNFRDIAKGKAK